MQPKWTDDITDTGFFGTEGGDGAEALDPAVIDLIDALMAQAPPGREGLVRTLLALQRVFDRVSWRVQELVADRFGLSPAQVAGVVSFYPKLSSQRRGRIKLDVCTGSGCFLRGGEQVLGRITQKTADGSSTIDEPRLAVQQERCLGLCGFGPVVRTHLRAQSITEPSEADEIVGSLLGDGTEREDDR